MQQSRQQSCAGSRRRFLRTSAGALALAAWGPILPGCGKKSARIAIVGAGLAGLRAAYVLKQAGVSAAVYEADTRVGGRVRTARDLVVPGTLCELGGEFIASHHAEILGLIKEFGLSLEDRRTNESAAFNATYFFGGTHYTRADVAAALRPVAARIATEARDTAATIDALSVAQYIDRQGLSAWTRDLLRVACVAAYGVDPEQQSALNLAALLARGEDFFTTSDQRYRIVGGNERLIERLSERLVGQIQLGYRLAYLKAESGAYTLRFQTAQGLQNVEADVVLLTLPFVQLQQVSLELDLPDWKQDAINGLGYGTHTKLFLGMNRRVWRQQNYNGDVISDEPFQWAWENAVSANGVGAGLTMMLGGRAGVEVGHDAPEKQAHRLLVGAERVFAGARDAFNDRAARFHWPSHASTRCSRACYAPGQWTQLRGKEFEPVGNIFFAGEHTSVDFQGTMNGAVETGRRAAEAILRTMG